MVGILVFFGMIAVRTAIIGGEERVFSATAVDPPPPYLPPPALSSIEKSQRQVAVKIPLLMGGMRVSRASGVLVDTMDKRGLVITAFHVIPQELDVVKARRILFGDAPATLRWVLPGPDGLALLEIDQIPEGMKAISFAEEVPLNTPTYALITGGYEYGGGTAIYFAPHLLFQGYVAGHAHLVRQASFETDPQPFGIEYLYLDRAARGGFSGAAFVKNSGELMGVGALIEGGYTVIVHNTTIRDFINLWREGSGSH